MSSLSAADAFDIVIVGAGMIGTAAAKYIVSHPASASLKVCLLGPVDNCTPGARGQHSDVARITRRIDATNRHWARWADRSIRRYRSIEAESGIPFYDPCGMVWLSSNDGAEVAKIRDSVASLPPDAQLGIREFHSVEEFRQGYAATGASALCIDPFGPSTIFTEDAGDGGGGVVHPNNLVRAQTRIAEIRGGARFHHLHLVASAIQRVGAATGPAEYHVTAAGKDGVPRVVSCARVVVCCGAFAMLHNLFPHGKTPDVELVPEIVALVPLTGESRPPESVCVISTSGPPDTHFYCVPPQFYDDLGAWFVKLVASASRTNDVPARIASLQEATAWTDVASTSADLKSHFTGIVRALYARWPLAEDNDACRTLQCVFDRTPTRMPYIGCVDGCGWFAAVGGNGKAAKSSDELGRLLSLHVLGDEVDVEDSCEFVWKV